MIGSNKGHATIDWNKDHLDHVLTGNLQIRAAPLSASGDLLTPLHLTLQRVLKEAHGVGPGWLVC